MDRPVLHTLVERLRAEERLQQFAAALPTRARVSEPVLPLAARGAARGARARPDRRAARGRRRARRGRGGGWFVGDDRVALFPSRGVHWGSGLEPPPHLVGERARALEVLERGGLVCASAAAVAEGLPPRDARPAPLAVRVGDEPGIDALAEQLASAGYERVERVEERGQFAVRGGLVDVFPTTGREPFRIELFGDEIEQIRAFSPFTQRALRTVDERDDLSGGRAAARARRDRPRARRGRRGRRRGARRPRAARSTARRTSSGRPTRCRPPGRSRASRRSRSTARPTLTQLPQGQPFSFDAQRPALAARGLSEAENELNGLLRQELDVVVAFPHRGEALRQQALLRRVSARDPRGGRDAREGSRSPCRRRAAGSSGASSASRCCRTRRSSASGRRARRPRRAARSRASPTSAPATTSCTRTTASRSCSGSRRRRSPASRATTCCSPIAATTACTCRTSRSARSAATSAPTRASRRCRSSAARRGTT